MNYKTNITILFFLFLSITLMAVPARRGIYTYTQPDGTRFQAYLSGDEFSRSLKTLDGCAVVPDKSGFYCYAAIDGFGRIKSSTVHVSPANSDSDAARASRSISHASINNQGASRRKLAARIRTESAAQIITKSTAPHKKNIIILAQFPDNGGFTHSRSDFVNMLTMEGYSSGGASGSALDYFNDQFEGRYEFDFVVSPIVTLSKGYAYYGANDDEGQDERVPELVAEACRLAAAQGVDFSQSDGDGDGETDNVFIFVNGLSEAEGAPSECIWPHHWYLYDGAGVSLTIGGKRINSYAIATEITHNFASGAQIFATIGTFCHEYSHSLGLKDHYDTDTDPSTPDIGSGGLADCIWGDLDLMDHGNYNNNGNTPPCYNAPELETFGIGNEGALAPGSYSLAPLSEEKRYLRADTDKNGEYFLFECRGSSGWDKYCGGTGLLIYHVDKSSNKTGYSDYYQTVLTAQERWWYNEVNCRPDHQCLDLIEAVPIAKDISQVFWPTGSHTAFAPNTSPAFRFWSGNTPDISIIDIKKSSGGVSFTVTGPLSLESVEEFQDAAIVLWSSSGKSDESIIEISDPSGKTERHVVSSYSTGRFSYTFEGLKPRTLYKVTLHSDDGSGVTVSTEFTTKAYYSDGYPFIYLNSAERNNDGSFIKGTLMPLRVYNAKDAAKVTWQYSSTTLSTDGSGYYKVIGNGTVKAIIDYKDGRREIISKNITVK